MTSVWLQRSAALDAWQRGGRGATEREEEEERVRYDDEFNVGRWYPALRRFTYRTAFAPLGVEAAKALVDSSEASRHPELMEEVAGDIDAAMREVGGRHGWFVRLGSRSPKDAVSGTAEMRRRLRERLERMPVGVSEVEAQNCEFEAFFAARSEASAVLSGAQAVELLRGSERVREDVERALRVDPGVLELVVRAYSPSVTVGSEFRGFVHGRRLTALSQYCFAVHFPSLCLAPQGLVQKLARDYFERSGIRDALPWDDCVLGLVLPPLEGSPSWTEVRVLEVNPWSRATSACLFDWTRDHDVLTARDLDNPTLRVLEEPLPVLRERKVAHPSLDLSGVALGQCVDQETRDSLQMAREFMEDDGERINSNLRYTLAGTIGNKSSWRVM